MSKEEFVISSPNGSKYKFVFEIKDENYIVITANEVKRADSFPKVYRDTFEKEKLSDFSNTDVTFKNAKGILKQIVSSFQSNKATFSLEDSQIIFSFFLFEKIPITVTIPLITPDALEEKLNFISSNFVSLINLSYRYNNLIKKISNNFSKNKNVAQFLHRQNSQLRKEINYSNLLKQQQKEIIQKLSSIKQEEKQKPPDKPSGKINLKKLKTIKNNSSIFNICFLKDGRLASCCDNKIVIHDKCTYEPEIKINDVFNVYSVCVLENGNLASSNGCIINIFEIKEKDYELIRSLRGHEGAVCKVIELKDGKLCSGSNDRTIKIWDNKNNYQCIQTLKEHEDNITCLIEINNYIISSCYYDDTKIWDKSTYKCIKEIDDIYCSCNNSISKLRENTVIFGGDNELFILDILSLESRSFEDKQLKEINSICVVDEDQILLGNSKGEIICYDSLSNQIIFTQKVHDDSINCIINNEDEKLVLSSDDTSISLYHQSSFIFLKNINNINKSF